MERHRRQRPSRTVPVEEVLVVVVVACILEEDTRGSSDVGEVRLPDGMMDCQSRPYSLPFISRAPVSCMHRWREEGHPHQWRLRASSVVQCGVQCSAVHEGDKLARFEKGVRACGFIMSEVSINKAPQAGGSAEAPSPMTGRDFAGNRREESCTTNVMFFDEGSFINNRKPTTSGRRVSRAWSVCHMARTWSEGGPAAEREKAGDRQWQRVYRQGSGRWLVLSSAP